jgi:hypothetical protein
MYYQFSFPGVSLPRGVRRRADRELVGAGLAEEVCATMPGLSASTAILLASALQLAAARAPASGPAPDSTAVIAVARPPAGPDPGLAELAHRLRAALRSRSEEVLDLHETRARLLGPAPAGSLAELDRLHAAALAAFEQGDFDRAARSLRAILDGLERLPESPEAYARQTRATIRLAYVERIRQRPAVAAQLMERLAATDPAFAVDEVQYPPSVRQAFEEARHRVAVRPRATLTVSSTGCRATAFLNGRKLGATPVSLRLPPGRYRVGGASETLRAPSTMVQLGTIDLAHDLDLGLAEALRADAGPGLALEPEQRAAGIARAGARLGVARVAAVNLLAEGEVQQLEGALHEVRSGAVVRQGRVRLASGSATSSDLEALARYLLTGRYSPGVNPVANPDPTPLGPLPLARAGALPPSLPLLELTSPGPPPLLLKSPAPSGGESRRRWLRPAAYAAGAVALGLAGVATWQAVSSRNGFRTADGMLGPTGALLPTADPAGYRRTRGAAESSRTAAYICAGSAATFAIAAGVLGYLSWDEQGAPVVRF